MGTTRQVELIWREGMRFEGGAPGAPPIAIDAEGQQAPSPMQALLLALAGCTGADVVSMLQKKRAALQGLRVEVVGERRDAHPRRYTAITLTYHIHAPGLAEAQARHAIELSLARYCSVTHSLAPDIAMRHALVLEA
jgi:putative redox protein